MITVNTIKENPGKSSIIGIPLSLAFIWAVVQGVFLIDDRYVHAAGFEQVQTRMVQDIEKKQTELKVQLIVKINNQDKGRYEDEIFKIEQLEPHQRTPSQRGLLERYKRKIQDINMENNRVQFTTSN